MSRFRSSLACLVLAVSLSWVSDPAAAQSRAADDETARTLFEAGRVYFERAQYEKAAESFAEAHRLSGRPILLLNLARALESAGRLDEAIDALERYLAGAEDQELRASAEKVLARLRADRERRDAEEERRAAEASDAEAGVRIEETPGDAPEPTAPVETRRLTRALSFASLGVGGASVVVAIATGVAHRGIYRDLERACPAGECDPSLRGEAERGRRLSRTSTAFTFVGAAALVGGVVGLVVDAKKKKRDTSPEAARLELTSGPGLAGGGLLLTF